MNIHFNFHGSEYKAGLTKEENDKLRVLFNDQTLEKQFGHSLNFYVKDKSVSFETPNRCHSDLFALNSICKALRSITNSVSQKFPPSCIKPYSEKSSFECKTISFT